MFNAESFIAGLSVRELSELRALLNSEEYSWMIDDYESGSTKQYDDDDL